MLFRPRRPRRPLRPGGPLQLLGRAQRLLEEGRHQEAAPIFERLAEGAAGRGMWSRAGDLALQAARCYLEAGQVEPALKRGRQALHLYGRGGLIGKVQSILPKMVQALENKGYHEQAQALRAEVEARLADRPPELRAVSPGPAERWPSVFHHPKTTPRELPAQCPSCGAPVRSDEVTWVDQTSAECPYCGSVVKATGEGR
jgi:tetratricopeptide (TPR) repeat protein